MTPLHTPSDPLDRTRFPVDPWRLTVVVARRQRRAPTARGAERVERIPGQSGVGEVRRVAVEVGIELALGEALEQTRGGPPKTGRVADLPVAQMLRGTAHPLPRRLSRSFRSCIGSPTHRARIAHTFEQHQTSRLRLGDAPPFAERTIGHKR